MIVSDWVWDEETYPNCFLFAITRADGQFTQVFECSDRRNDISRIIACFRYMKANNQTMFGFNSLGFDYPIAHDTFLKNPERYEKMSGALIAKALYEAAQNQIESMRGRFPKTIPERDHHAAQADLYKIWHFDNAAKATGLKMIEFNMRAHNIEDLPYAVGTYLTHEQMDNLRKYNLHDVEMTRQFYLKSQAQISLRRELTQKYNRNFLNHNDTKIGKDYFIMRLEEAGIATKNGAGEVRQTIRDEIIIKDCLFDYYDFQYPEFLAIVEWLKRQEITETKGVFSDITEEDLGDVAQYAEMVVKKEKLKTKEDIEKFKRTRKLGWIEEKELKATEDLLDADGNPVMYYPNGKDGKPDMTKKPKKVKVPKKSYYGCWHIATNLNVVINGFRFDFGTGGIHGSISNKIARANHKYEIVDADVASMYPNLAISNRVYPEHLGEKFCDIYQDVYEQRKSYPKGAPENAMLKLALNGVYGDSNNKYGPFYDPAYTMKITINGQLSLCLLAEKLMEAIPLLKIIQVNTDGITVALPREDRQKYNEICEAWQKQVGLQLEFADYEKMIIRDVNNYIAVYTNGKVKRKGAYQYEDLGWHQDQGGLVIPKAAEAYMLHGTPVEQFVWAHKDEFDFMLRVKVPRSSKLVLCERDEEGKMQNVEQQQNICRYYPSTKGRKLVKIMPPSEDSEEDREFDIAGDYQVKVCNNMDNFSWNDIDYDYYITEAKKLIIE